MKKLLIKLLILLITLGMAGGVYAAAPSRSFDYVAGEIIDPDEVTRNEDNIFSYLQTGVDTYTNSSITSAHITDGTITSADILDGTIASADILDGTIASADILDGTIVNADVNASAAIAASKLDSTVVETDTTQTISGAKTFTGNNTFAGTTIADLGTVTTADINGGTLDGVQVGGVTATGELFVNNASDMATGLVVQGTSGQVLTSAGTGANPTWADSANIELFTSSGTFTTDANTTKVWITMCGGGGGGAGSYGGYAGGGGGAGAYIIRGALDVTASTNYTVTVGTGGAGGADNGNGGPGLNSSFAGDSHTITCNGGSAGAEGTGGAGGTASGDNDGADGAGGIGGAGGTPLTTAGGAGGAGQGNINGAGGGGGSNQFGEGGLGGTDALAASAGMGYGSGGGGANEDGGASELGGAGAAGFVMVEW